jgi:hypothetical protein
MSTLHHYICAFYVRVCVCNSRRPGFASGSAVWYLWWTNWHWNRFCSEFFGFPCQCHSTVAVHAEILPGEWIIGLFVASVYRHIHTPSSWTTTPRICNNIINLVPCHHCMTRPQVAVGEDLQICEYIWFVGSCKGYGFGYLVLSTHHKKKFITKYYEVHGTCWLTWTRQWIVRSHKMRVFLN